MRVEKAITLTEIIIIFNKKRKAKTFLDYYKSIDVGAPQKIRELK